MIGLGDEYYLSTGRWCNLVSGLFGSLGEGGVSSGLSRTVSGIARRVLGCLRGHTRGAQSIENAPFVRRETVAAQPTSSCARTCPESRRGAFCAVVCKRDARGASSEASEARGASSEASEAHGASSEASEARGASSEASESIPDGLSCLQCRF